MSEPDVACSYSDDPSDEYTSSTSGYLVQRQQLLIRLVLGSTTAPFVPLASCRVQKNLAQLGCLVRRIGLATCWSESKSQPDQRCSCWCRSLLPSVVLLRPCSLEMRFEVVSKEAGLGLEEKTVQLLVYVSGGALRSGL